MQKTRTHSVLQYSVETAVIVVALAIYKPNQRGTRRLRKKRKKIAFFWEDDTLESHV